MLKEMTLDDLFSVSTTLNTKMSFRGMQSAAKTFASDKSVSIHEAMAIMLVAFQITKEDSIQGVLRTKENRLRELEAIEGKAKLQNETSLP